MFTTEVRRNILANPINFLNFGRVLSCLYNSIFEDQSNFVPDVHLFVQFLGSGGASVITGNSPAHNFMIWHNGPPGNRIDEFGPTAEYDPSGSYTCASALVSKNLTLSPHLASRSNPSVPHHWKARVPNWPVHELKLEHERKELR